MKATAVRASLLAAPPQQVWTQLLAGGFVTRYLGLPDTGAALAAQRRLQGCDADGTAWSLSVTEALAPAALALRLQREGQPEQWLRWTIAPCGSGSRLTVVHEDAPASGTQPPVAALLAAPLPSVLAAPSVASAAALQAARQYLQGSADALQALLDAHPTEAAVYAKPVGGGFSLAEHGWHLADIESLGWGQRLQRLLTGERPTLAGVDGDALAQQQRYQQRPWRGAMRRFIAQRRRSLQWLRRFDEAVLQRPARFGGRDGTAGDVLAAMLAHDHEHRLEMAALFTHTHPGATP